MALLAPCVFDQLRFSFFACEIHRHACVSVLRCYFSNASSKRSIVLGLHSNVLLVVQQHLQLSLLCEAGMAVQRPLLFRRFQTFESIEHSQIYQIKPFLIISRGSGLILVCPCIRVRPSWVDKTSVLPPVPVITDWNHSGCRHP